MVTELEALILTFSKQPLLRLTCPRRLGAGPITEPGGREAGMSARTGASTILMLLRLIRLLYLGKDFSMLFPLGGLKSHFE